MRTIISFGAPRRAGDDVAVVGGTGPGVA